MKDKTILQSKAEGFELKVRQNVWENIEKQLPKENKKKLFIFWWFGALALAVMGSFFYFYGNFNTSSNQKNQVVQSDVLNNKKANENNVAEKEKVEEKVISAEKPNGIASENSTGTAKLAYKPFEKNTYPVSPKNKIFPQTELEKLKQKSNVETEKTNTPKDKLVSNVTVTKSKDSVKISSEIVTKVKVFNKDSQLTETSILKLASDSNNLINKGKTNEKLKNSNPLKGQFFVLAGLGIFNARLQLKPSLMKIPTGFGKQGFVTVGRMFNKWSLGLELGYENLTQQTTMPGTYNPDYVKVVDPNTASAVPDLYRSKLSDTNYLLVPGSNHNSIKQSFSLLSLGLDVNYSLFKIRGFSLFAGVSPKYIRMVGAETFFWDNLNGIGVPFDAKDKTIVKVNQLSSKLKLGLGYDVSNQTSVWVSPYYERYFSPFLKHYYQISFKNWGFSTGVRYQF